MGEGKYEQEFADATGVLNPEISAKYRPSFDKVLEGFDLAHSVLDTRRVFYMSALGGGFDSLSDKHQQLIGKKDFTQRLDTVVTAIAGKKDSLDLQKEAYFGGLYMQIAFMEEATAAELLAKKITRSDCENFGVCVAHKGVEEPYVQSCLMWDNDPTILYSENAIKQIVKSSGITQKVAEFYKKKLASPVRITVE